MTHPIATQLADQIVDLVRATAGPVTLTRIREVVGHAIPQSDVITTLDALVLHSRLIAEDLPGNRRTYREQTGPVAVSLRPVAATPAKPAPMSPMAPAARQAPPKSVAAAVVLRYLAGVYDATCADISAALGLDRKALSVRLCDYANRGRITGDNSSPKRYRITEQGRHHINAPATTPAPDGKRPATAKPALRKTAPKPAPTARSEPPAPAYADILARIDGIAARLNQPPLPVIERIELKRSVLAKLSQILDPEIGEVLLSIKHDILTAAGHAP